MIKSLKWKDVSEGIGGKQNLHPINKQKLKSILRTIMRKTVYMLILLIKKEKLIKRVQFAPKGYQIYCKGISELQWQDDSHVIIKRAFGYGFKKTSDHWIIGINGSIDYYSPKVENTAVDPHGLFDLGILYWEGKAIMQNKDKGLELIKKAADLNSKHAQKWLERNIKQVTANKQQTD